MLNVSFAGPALPNAGALALLVPEGASPSGLWHAADEATGGAVTRAFAAAEFTGKDGQSCTILAPSLKEGALTRIVAAGLGRETDLTPRKIEEAAGTAIAGLSREQEVTIAADTLTPRARGTRRHGCNAAQLPFRPLPHQTEAGRTATPVHTDGARRQSRGGGGSLDPLSPPSPKAFSPTRDLVSEPANILTPAEFATRIEALSHLGLSIEVHGQPELEALGLRLPARRLTRQRQPATHGGHALERRRRRKAGRLHRQGVVTFDTGGISIKPRRRHGGHEVGHGGRRRRRRPDGRPRRPQRQRSTPWVWSAWFGKHAPPPPPSAPAT